MELLLTSESDLESDSEIASISVCLHVVVIAVLISLAKTVMIAATFPSLKWPKMIETRRSYKTNFKK